MQETQCFNQGKTRESLIKYENNSYYDLYAITWEEMYKLIYGDNEIDVEELKPNTKHYFKPDDDLFFFKSDDLYNIIDKYRGISPLGEEFNNDMQNYEMSQYINKSTVEVEHVSFKYKGQNVTEDLELKSSLIYPSDADLTDKRLIKDIKNNTFFKAMLENENENIEVGIIADTGEKCYKVGDIYFKKSTVYEKLDKYSDDDIEYKNNPKDDATAQINYQQRQQQGLELGF